MCLSSEISFETEPSTLLMQVHVKEPKKSNSINTKPCRVSSFPLLAPKLRCPLLYTVEILKLKEKIGLHFQCYHLLGLYDTPGDPIQLAGLEKL